MIPPENMFNLRRVESFYIKEDWPEKEIPHPDKKIRDAVLPAILMVSAEGKQVLVYYKSEDN